MCITLCFLNILMFFGPKIDFNFLSFDHLLMHYQLHCFDIYYRSLFLVWVWIIAFIYSYNKITSATQTSLPNAAKFLIDFLFPSSPSPCFSISVLFATTAHYNCLPKSAAIPSKTLKSCPSKFSMKGLQPHPSDTLAPKWSAFPSLSWMPGEENCSVNLGKVIEHLY